MDKPYFKVAGIYHDRPAAEAAVRYLREHGIAEREISLLGPEDSLSQREVGDGLQSLSSEGGAGAAYGGIDEKLESDDSNEVGREVLKEHVKGGVIGGVIGGAAGAAGVAAMTAAGATLFVAAPVIAVAAMASWGAMAGAGVGTGLAIGRGQIEATIKDAIKDGHYAVLVQSPDEEAEERAKELMEHTMNPEQVLTT